MTEPNGLQRDIGRLEARVTAVERDLAEIKSDVKAIRSAVDQGRGRWSGFLLVAGLSGAMGAAATKLSAFVPLLK